MGPEASGMAGAACELPGGFWVAGMEGSADAWPWTGALAGFSGVLPWLAALACFAASAEAFADAAAFCAETAAACASRPTAFFTTSISTLPVGRL